MKLNIIAPFTVVLLACGQSGPVLNLDASQDTTVDPEDVVMLTELPDTTSESDIETGSDVASDIVADVLSDSGANECRASLKSWMCESDGCAAGSRCLGYIPSCQTPPCWGAWCDFFPGSCVPEITNDVCRKNDECSPGYACYRGLFSLYGLCAWIGTDGRCLSNFDCSHSQVCAGEVISDVGEPGHSPLLPGICLPALTVEGECWEDDACVAGWCDNAVLCDPADETCAPTPGICVSGPIPECEPADSSSDVECQDSPWGNWCVGSEGTINRWCAPPPAGKEADGECWEDRDCGPETTGRLCRSSVACPPRAWCRHEGFHSGICGPAPADGEGLTLMFEDQTTSGEVALSTASRVVLVNRGPVSVFFPACQTVMAQIQIDGEWPTHVLDWGFEAPECSAGVGGKVLLRLPPGAGMVLGIPIGSGFNPRVDRRIRLILDYRLGCEPGKDLDSNMTCLQEASGLWRRMYSPDVLWVD
ncbi:MAG TPA: hypothetical protein PLZ31_04165 [Myxococcota bacterium]|nr:hypothetical protein [Myxococcota bacterium]HOD06576.1 hypothetical protein [Myxococcota bacterium]HPB50410.1 hypothetical protein [Myxococcota bacterium]